MYSLRPLLTKLDMYARLYNGLWCADVIMCGPISVSTPIIHPDTQALVATIIYMLIFDKLRPSQTQASFILDIYLYTVWMIRLIIFIHVHVYHIFGRK